MRGFHLLQLELLVSHHTDTPFYIIPLAFQDAHTLKVLCDHLKQVLTAGQAVRVVPGTVLALVEEDSLVTIEAQRRDLGKVSAL